MSLVKMSLRIQYKSKRAIIHSRMNISILSLNLKENLSIIKFSVLNCMIALFFTYKDMKNIKRQNGGLLINTLKKEKTNIYHLLDQP